MQIPIYVANCKHTIFGVTNFSVIQTTHHNNSNKMKKWTPTLDIIKSLCKIKLPQSQYKYTQDIHYTSLVLLWVQTSTETHHLIFFRPYRRKP